MAEGKAWVFEQLQAPGKILQLDGWGGPMGRPRQDPVVTDGIEARKQVYYYPGNSSGPTRHIFGHKQTPWEIKGRFRDRADGKGFAVSKTLEVRQFVADLVPVRVSWGDITGVEGFIDSFESGRESEGEVAWRMTIAVDVDLYAKDKPKKVKPPVDTAYIAKIIAQDLAKAFGGMPELPSTDLLSGLDSVLSFPANVAGSALEVFDNLASVVTGVAGIFQKSANGISDFEKATFAELNRIVNVSVQLRGGIAALRETYTNASIDSALIRDRADDNAKFWEGQSAAELACRDIVAQLSTLEREAQLAIRGRGGSGYAAKMGDTWEAISTIAYGSPDRANDIQDANGAPPGGWPVPGTHYVLPP